MKVKGERLKTPNYGLDNHTLKTEIGIAMKHSKQEESKVANEETENSNMETTKK